MGKTFQRKDRDDKDWYISFYEPTGRRVKRRIGPSKKVAEAALCKVEVAIAEGKYLELKKQNRIKFEDFLEEYYRLHCADLLPDTKNGETREVPMNDEVVKVLSGIKRHSNSLYVFWTKNGKRIDDIRKSFCYVVFKSALYMI